MNFSIFSRILCRGGAVCKASCFLYCIFFWKNLYCKKYYSFIEVVCEDQIFFENRFIWIIFEPEI